MLEISDETFGGAAFTPHLAAAAAFGHEATLVVNPPRDEPRALLNDLPSTIFHEPFPSPPVGVSAAIQF